MANPWKVTLARQLAFSGESRISRRHFWVVPQKFQNRQHPILAEKTALAEKPRAIRVLEAIHGIAQQSGVSRIQNRIFVIALTRGCAIGKQFVEIGVANIPEQLEVMSWINALRGPLEFRE